LPAVFDDFFKPWNEWFDLGSGVFNRTLTVPAVNIMETKDDFKLSFAVPGMKKDDFHIGIEGNMLTISSEKEEVMKKKKIVLLEKSTIILLLAEVFLCPNML